MDKKKESKPEFWLVIAMLITLSGLLILLFVLPVIVCDGKSGNMEKLIEFSKWILPALLGAFGAWIGAGAAYFFGKESLKESSRSTQQAIDTLKTNFERFQIEDTNPMRFDPNFTFTLDDKVNDVLKGLDDNPKYWFVPIFKEGKIEDVIHLEAFWRFKAVHPPEIVDKANVKSVVDYIESKLTNKKDILHGFFVIAKQTDKITEILERMTETIDVAIICDEKGNPTHCVSRKNLRAFLLNVS
jgi:hypothetical protein